MAKHKVTFEELVTYEVEIDIPEDVDPEWTDDSGKWFELLDEQNPNWITESSVSVEDRTVLDVDGEYPND